MLNIFFISSSSLIYSLYQAIIDRLNKLSINTTNAKEANRADNIDTNIIAKTKDSDISIADAKKASGVNKLSISKVNNKNIDKVNNLDINIVVKTKKPDTDIINTKKTNKIDKLNIGIIYKKEVNRVNNPGSSTIVKDPQRLPMAKKPTALASFFSFYKIICLFFFTLELETFGSLTTFSMLSIIDIFVKQDTLSFKQFCTKMCKSIFNKLALSIKELLIFLKLLAKNSQFQRVL